MGAGSNIFLSAQIQRQRTYQRRTHYEASVTATRKHSP